MFSGRFSLRRMSGNAAVKLYIFLSRAFWIFIFFYTKTFVFWLYCRENQAFSTVRRVPILEKRPILIGVFYILNRVFYRPAVIWTGPFGYTCRKRWFFQICMKSPKNFAAKTEMTFNGMNTLLNIMRLHKTPFAAYTLYICKKSPVFPKKTGDCCIYVAFWTLTGWPRRWFLSNIRGWLWALEAPSRGTLPSWPCWR